jgi:hypothetical protein
VCSGLRRVGRRCRVPSRAETSRSVGDLDPMPMRWRLSDPVVMGHDGHIALTRLRFAGGSDRMRALSGQFRELCPRRLVIIGSPGSGKTTLAVQLLLEGWDPQIQPRVQDWRAGQFAQTYSDLCAFGAGVVQELADQGSLLPALDGLDDIPTECRGVLVRMVRDPL